jgi:hypothetical protein
MSTLKERIQSFEDDSKVLERIASSYSEDSAEYKVVRRAAIALWYVLREKNSEFESYFASFDRDLSPEERQELQRMGIDPDSDLPGEC